MRGYDEFHSVSLKGNPDNGEHFRQVGIGNVKSIRYHSIGYPERYIVGVRVEYASYFEFFPEHMIVKLSAESK